MLMKDKLMDIQIFLKTLISRRENGVVTFNTWGVYDKNSVSDHEFKYIYDSNLKPKKLLKFSKYVKKQEYFICVF